MAVDPSAPRAGFHFLSRERRRHSSKREEVLWSVSRREAGKRDRRRGEGSGDVNISFAKSGEGKKGEKREKRKRKGRKSRLKP